METILLAAFVLALALSTATRRRVIAGMALLGVLSVLAVSTPTTTPNATVDLYTRSN